MTKSVTTAITTTATPPITPAKLPFCHTVSTPMTDAEFLSRYQETLRRIEETVEATINADDADIDYESGNDMLTLSFSNRSVAILSRQSAIQQLWLAARSGGFHFDFDPSRNAWVCTSTRQTLADMLQTICQEQGAVGVCFQD
jgi:CyaY protein